MTLLHFTQYAAARVRVHEHDVYSSRRDAMISRRAFRWFNGPVFPRIHVNSEISVPNVRTGISRRRRRVHTSVQRPNAQILQRETGFHRANVAQVPHANASTPSSRTRFMLQLKSPRKNCVFGAPSVPSTFCFLFYLLFSFFSFFFFFIRRNCVCRSEKNLPGVHLIVPRPFSCVICKNERI